MNAISKKVAMGILCTFALLPFVSCSLDSLFSTGGSGSVEVSISIPERLGRSALPADLQRALRPAEGATSRFINPDTRYIQATVWVGGNRGNPITASIAIPLDSASASLSVRKVPIGNHTLTVSLYDGGNPPVLLSEGTSPISVIYRMTARANVTAVPVTDDSFPPGPFGAYGATIAAPNSGGVFVYKVSVPRSGPYRLRCEEASGKNVLGADNVFLYDAKGRKVPSTHSGSGSFEGEYAGLDAAVYYAVIESPTNENDALRVSLDADMRITMTANTAYVDTDLTVMDRTRPFTLNVPCGCSSVQGISFGSAEGRGAPYSLQPDARTISVTPGANGLTSWDTDSPGSSVDFTDGLLGIARTGVVFRFAGAPHRFVYCNAAGSRPADSSGAAATTLNAAIATLNTLSEGAAIALLDGESYSLAQAGIDNPAILLSGCSSTGTRGAAYGKNPVTCSEKRYGLAVNADNSRISGLDFSIPGGNVTSSEYFFSIAGSCVLSDCGFSYSGNLSLASASSIEYSALYISAAQVSLDRCSIVLPGLALAGAGTHRVSGIQDLATANVALAISNSLISAGTPTATSASGQTFCGLYLPSMSNGFLTLAGSTVSSGLVGARTTLSFQPFMRAIQLAPGASNYLYSANCLLIAGDLSSPNSALVFSGAALGGFRFNDMVLGYAEGYGSPTGGSYILFLDAANRIHYPDWPTPAYASCPLFPVASLGLRSVASSNGGFLVPSAASPAALLSGGADLSVDSVRSPLSLSGVDAERLALDRHGSARTGNGSTGYSVGAFEVD